MGNAGIVDMMLGVLHDPFQTFRIGVTAENVAKKYDITREAQDALESHRRAFSSCNCYAICPGWVLTSLVEKQIKARAAADGMDTDEARGALQ